MQSALGVGGIEAPRLLEHGAGQLRVAGLEVGVPQLLEDRAALRGELRRFQQVDNRLRILSGTEKFISFFERIAGGIQGLRRR